MQGHWNHLFARIKQCRAFSNFAILFPGRRCVFAFNVLLFHKPVSFILCCYHGIVRLPWEINTFIGEGRKFCDESRVSMYKGEVACDLCMIYCSVLATFQLAFIACICEWLKDLMKGSSRIICPQRSPCPCLCMSYCSPPSSQEQRLIQRLWVGHVCRWAAILFLSETQYGVMVWVLD